MINTNIKKIKVLHAIRQGKIGGGESHVLDLVEELNADVYESIVLSFTEGPMVEKLRSRGIKTYVIKTEKPFNFFVWKAVKKLLLEENVNLVHAHGTRANSNVNFSARKLNIPIIYTVHGWSFHPDQKFLLRRLRIAGEQYLVNNTNLTICVSDNNWKDAKLLFPMQRSEVIKYGINLKKFNFNGAYNNVRMELGISPDTLLVGYIVRMTIQKDPFTLIKAIALIPSMLDIKFLFVGDGDLKEESIQLAKELNIEHRIVFLNFREDVPALLSAIDIYCLPSLWEGLPIGMLEAMAMKKAVVVTAIDGAKEVIINNQNGILIPPQNPDKLAEAIVSLMQTELRNKIAEGALVTIRENFTVQTMTRRVEKAYAVLV